MHSYVAIRADEQSREGYQATHANMRVHFPLRDDGINRAGVIETLESAGQGEPEYYRWRTRSGCTFCFFQQKIEWVRLMREHPQAFDDAKGYEKTARAHGSPFTWSQGENLDELSAPARVDEIEREFEQRRARLLARRRVNPLAELRPYLVPEIAIWAATRRALSPDGRTLSSEPRPLGIVFLTTSAHI
ncbi:hypothetical protein [Mesorhizobium sp. IMUNJ 23232]|uniref:hypothetical protein n=1 Tax=Mesorhizobium sp. IMUNJ 23232 TaxID=3376064 RepID=UPI0037986C60